MNIEEALEKDIKDAYNVTLYSKASISRILDVHPSELPICPTAYMLRYLGIASKLVNKSDLRSTITLGIGTYVHRCMQDFLPHTMKSRMIGDWTCNKCHKTYIAREKLDACENCGCKDFTYDEIAINYKGFAGHIDTVYKYEDSVAIVDYKTATLSNYLVKAQNPGINYQMQIRAYALLLKLQYGIKVTDAFLVFIAKEKPGPNTFALYHEEITKAKLHDTFEFLSAQRLLKRQLVSLKTYDEFMSILPEPCSNEYCEACSSGKFNESIKKIKELWDESLFPIKEYIIKSIE